MITLGHVALIKLIMRVIRPLARVGDPRSPIRPRFSLRLPAYLLTR